MTRDWADKYFDFLYRRKVPLHFLLVLVTGASLFLASRLELRTDFAELLPGRLPSVKAFHKADARIGGTSLLLIGVSSPKFEANRDFVEALAKKLQPLVGKSLRFYEYRYLDIRDYAEKYALHYLTLDQLRNVRNELKTRIEGELDSAMGGFLGLDDDAPKATPAAPKKSLFDMLADSKLDPSIQAFASYRDAYLSGDSGKVLVMTVRPMGSSLGITGGQKLINEIQAMVDELKPASFQPEMKVIFTGGVPDTIEEFNAIRQDIVGTALLLTALILGTLFLFFWSFRIVGLLVFNLLFGVIWTFGITQLHIGYLNTQTAFLGSLVAGTGINYGIIFVSRYLEMRRRHVETRSAVVEAIRSTLTTTLIASSTTAVSFVSLLAADNKGFSQFGFIGGVGIALCWLSAFLILPLWLYLLEQRFPNKKHYANPLAHRLHPLGERIGRGIVTHAKTFTVLMVLMSVVSAFGLRKLAADPLEYNFDNVRNKFTIPADVEKMRQRIYDAFPTSLTPSIIIADHEQDARAMCNDVRAIQSSLPPEKNVIRACTSLYDIIPPVLAAGEQPEQRKLFDEIKGLLGRRAMRLSLEPEMADMANRMRLNLSYAPPTLADLPPQLVRRFTEKDGRVGLIGFINPDGRKPLNDGRNLINFTDSLAPLERPDAQGNTRYTVAGDSFVLADLLRGLHQDAPLVSGLALGGVMLVAIFLCGGIMNGLFMTFCLLLGVWWMLGIQGFMGLKYNFFNFIALPLTFGIGVDYPVNVFIRCRQEGYKNFHRIFVGSGMAVILCSLTTTIGYYTLLGATSQALAGFGRLAIIGEVTCVVTAVVTVPVILRLIGKFKDG
ncbi:MAG: MMPL family transporter [Bdellovibrionales bacterium]|nr:MMPL family transporter [Bdellovibrionales bacterium]